MCLTLLFPKTHKLKHPLNIEEGDKNNLSITFPGTISSFFQWPTAWIFILVYVIGWPEQEIDTGTAYLYRSHMAIGTVPAISKILQP